MKTRSSQVSGLATRRMLPAITSSKFQTPAGFEPSRIWQICSDLVEVIALLAKQDIRKSLDNALSMNSADKWRPGDTRSRQRQRRLSPTEGAELARRYIAGATAKELAQRFHIHRTTVLAQLERQGVDRRRCLRRMADTEVTHAALIYAEGHSLKTTAAHFGVDAETLRREFKKAGIHVRPRRGWAPSPALVPIEVNPELGSKEVKE